MNANLNGDAICIRQKSLAEPATSDVVFPFAPFCYRHEQLFSARLSASIKFEIDVAALRDVELDRRDLGVAVLLQNLKDVRIVFLLRQAFLMFGVVLGSRRRQ